MEGFGWELLVFFSIKLIEKKKLRGEEGERKDWLSGRKEAVKEPRREEKEKGEEEDDILK